MMLGIFACFFIARLSGLGVGSAGLFVVYLTLVEQMPQLLAQGTNLAFFLFSSGAAMVVHALKTKLLYGCILILLLGGIPGALIGSRLAHAIPQSLLRQLFGVLLIISGAAGLFSPKKNTHKK